MNGYDHKRQVFSDGWNSFAHFTLGAISQTYYFIPLLFLIYQFNQENQENTSVDVTEFALGYGFSCLVPLNKTYSP